MNAVFLLVGLLVLSYLGNLLVTRRAGGGIGSASGVEYAALGFVLGPTTFDLVNRRDLAAFEPLVQVAIGWLAFAIGLEFGVAEDRRVRPTRLLLGSLGAALTGTGVAVAAWCATGFVPGPLSPADRLLLSGGLGAACCETARYAVGQTAGRRALRGGPVSTCLNEVARAEGLPPLLAVAVAFAIDPPRFAAMPAPLCAWPAVTIGMAIVLGAGAALLLRGETPLAETWGVLFGVALLTVGVATRLGLSTLAAGFFAGLTLSVLSRHRRELRRMVGPTERPVLLPALWIAGARLDFHATPALPWIAAAAVGARLLAQLVSGWVLAAGAPCLRKAGPLVGLSLASCGALAPCVGLAFALRFPGAVGDTVLVAAVLSALVGEGVGPAMLRRALASAGEIDGAGAQGAAAGGVPA